MAEQGEVGGACGGESGPWSPLRPGRALPEVQANLFMGHFRRFKQLKSIYALPQA